MCPSCVQATNCRSFMSACPAAISVDLLLLLTQKTDDVLPASGATCCPRHKPHPLLPSRRASRPRKPVPASVYPTSAWSQNRPLRGCRRHGSANHPLPNHGEDTTHGPAEQNPVRRHNKGTLLPGCSRSVPQFRCTAAGPPPNGCPSSGIQSRPEPVLHLDPLTLPSHNRSDAPGLHWRPNASDPVDTASHKAKLPLPTLLPANCSSARSRSAALPDKTDSAPAPPSAQTNLRSAGARAPTRSSTPLSISPSRTRSPCLSIPSLSLSYNCSTSLDVSFDRSLTASSSRR